MNAEDNAGLGVSWGKRICQDRSTPPSNSTRKTACVRRYISPSLKLKDIMLSQRRLGERDQCCSRQKRHELRLYEFDLATTVWTRASLRLFAFPQSSPSRHRSIRDLSAVAISMPSCPTLAQKDVHIVGRAIKSFVVSSCTFAFGERKCRPGNRDFAFGIPLLFPNMQSRV